MANASIEDAGSGRWRVRWRERWQGDDEGRRGRWRQKQHTVHGTESDAERYRADVIDDLRRQGYHDPEEHAPKIAPPASLLDGLLAFVDALEHLDEVNATTAATHRLRVGILAEDLYAVTELPEDEPLPVTVLDRDLFIALASALKKRGKTVPARALGLLWRAWGWLAADPAAWPRVPPRPATPVGFVPKRKTYGRTDAPKMHHVDACLRHLRDRGASREVLVAVICQRFTGLRVGQVLGMERADLDLAAGSLTVRFGKSRSEKAEMRTVPLSRHLLAEPLFREQLDAAPPTGRIFKVKVRVVLASRPAGDGQELGG